MFIHAYMKKYGNNMPTSRRTAPLQANPPVLCKPGKSKVEPKAMVLFSKGYGFVQQKLRFSSAKAKVFFNKS